MKKLLLIALIALPVQAADIYRCANGKYQQTPCPNNPNAAPIVYQDISKERQLEALKEDEEQAKAQQAQAAADKVQQEQQRALQVERDKALAAQRQAEAARALNEARERAAIRSRLTGIAINPTNFPDAFAVPPNQ
ncbi:MAG: hypothetical protein WC782_03790 [Methylococcaceae bacterium]|jgi:uncharacterized protein YaiL (DUF2058 family)